MVWDNDAGPLVNHWDEEESGAQDGHQEEGPKKHPIQNLGYKLPILDHLKKNKQCFRETRGIPDTRRQTFHRQ